MASEDEEFAGADERHDDGGGTKGGGDENTEGLPGGRIPNPPPRDAWVSRVVDDPANPPAAVLLSGFVGDAAEEGRSRIYTDASLASYVEVQDEDVLHHEALNGEVPEGGSLVWVRADARITPGGGTGNRGAAGGDFFTGPVLEQNRKAGMGGAGQRGQAPTMLMAGCYTRLIGCTVWACPTQLVVCNTALPIVCSHVCYAGGIPGGPGGIGGFEPVDTFSCPPTVGCFDRTGFGGAEPRKAEAGPVGPTGYFHCGELVGNTGWQGCGQQGGGNVGQTGWLGCGQGGQAGGEPVDTYTCPPTAGCVGKTGWLGCGQGGQAGGEPVDTYTCPPTAGCVGKTGWLGCGQGGQAGGEPVDTYTCPPTAGCVGKTGWLGCGQGGQAGGEPVDTYTCPPTVGCVGKTGWLGCGQQQGPIGNTGWQGCGQQQGPIGRTGWLGCGQQGGGGLPGGGFDPDGTTSMDCPSVDPTLCPKRPDFTEHVYPGGAAQPMMARGPIGPTGWMGCGQPSQLIGCTGWMGCGQPHISLPGCIHTGTCSAIDACPTRLCGGREGADTVHAAAAGAIGQTGWLGCGQGGGARQAAAPTGQYAPQCPTFGFTCTYVHCPPQTVATVCTQHCPPQTVATVCTQHCPTLPPGCPPPTGPIGTVATVCTQIGCPTFGFTCTAFCQAQGGAEAQRQPQGFGAAAPQGAGTATFHLHCPTLGFTCTYVHCPGAGGGIGGGGGGAGGGVGGAMGGGAAAAGPSTAATVCTQLGCPRTSTCPPTFQPGCGPDHEHGGSTAATMCTQVPFCPPTIHCPPQTLLGCPRTSTCPPTYTPGCGGTGGGGHAAAVPTGQYAPQCPTFGFTCTYVHCPPQTGFVCAPQTGLGCPNTSTCPVSADCPPPTGACPPA
jgi:hypothetical protein